MLSQQDQEMRRNVPDPLFAGGSHFCGSGAGDETTPAAIVWRIPVDSKGESLCGNDTEVHADISRAAYVKEP